MGVRGPGNGVGASVSDQLLRRDWIGRSKSCLGHREERLGVAVTSVDGEDGASVLSDCGPDACIRGAFTVVEESSNLALNPFAGHSRGIIPIGGELTTSLQSGVRQ